MRRYSVWNPSAGVWDYYQAQGDLRAGVFAPPARMGSAHRLGMSPEEAERTLPVGATLVGRGPQAVGMVAGRKPLGFLGLEGSTLFRMAVIGGIGYAVWKYALSPERKKKARAYLRGR